MLNSQNLIKKITMDMHLLKLILLFFTLSILTNVLFSKWFILISNEFVFENSYIESYNWIEIILLKVVFGPLIETLIFQFLIIELIFKVIKKKT